MTLFFSFKSRYVVNNTADHVRSVIKDIIEHRGYDLSENITGQLQDDGKFSFSPRWTLGYIRIFGFPQSFTYLNGTLTEEGSKTVIQTTARPNYAIVIVFYFLIFVMCAKLFGIDLLGHGTMSEVFQSFSIMCFVLAGLMMFGAMSLRKRFERLMQLPRKE